ncbi:DUF721 domain-containing protein [Synechococcus sp. CBW1107]|uniref:DUF721 domain-containing protein n=1 Tax=Synechococcus sp. CBW1107 TaxID=2789857 RepID=UPI002AD53DB3|nr:DUF721 domain-containing protein [Synechococcus sp. CBW1107]CAK6700048.1 hypothetical protein IFHNHDMJ_02761 [Synechococcus sp. CBW1107]
MAPQTGKPAAAGEPPEPNQPDSRPSPDGPTIGESLSRKLSAAGRQQRPASSRRRARNPAAASRRIGSVSVLLPPPRPPAEALATCLEALQQHWRQEGQLAALWQVWPRLAGAQLAPHCQPLSFHGGLLTIGAAPGPWLQALRYNRHQLLGALRGAGFTVRDLRVQQHHAQPLPPAGTTIEAETWAQHPSRVDVHGLGVCPRCSSPAPLGEMGRWGHCSFCRRQALAEAAAAADLARTRAAAAASGLGQ